MDQMKTGQRLLLALMSQEEDEDVDVLGEFSISGIVLCISSIFCLLTVVFLCACKERKSNDNSHTDGKSKITEEDIGMTTETTPSLTDPGSIDNGGLVSNRNSANMSKHSRQASSASGTNIRPPSLRELPEPPVDTHHSRNTSMSGVVVLPASTKSIDEEGVANGIVAPVIIGGSGNHGNVMGDPDSNGYDHFGPKTTEPPPGYDHLGSVKVIRSDGQNSSTSEIHSSVVDGHHYAQPTERTYAQPTERTYAQPTERTYAQPTERTYAQPKERTYAQPKERTYDVVKDVKPVPSPLYHSDSFSQVKDEDPYNQIGESDNTVSSALISRIHQSIDNDDLYATVQGDSDGSFAAIVVQGGIGKATNGTNTKPPTSFIPPTSPSHHPPHPNKGQKETDREEEEDEYAVVQKQSSSNSPSGGGATPTNVRRREEGSGDGNVSPYDTYGPPEPPRLYVKDRSVLDGGDEEDDYYQEGDLRSPGARDHMYSKVTARESLASMSARNALNPYETVPDLPENTYATVDGGSGDGVIHAVTLRHHTDRMTMDQHRLSQNSDTYAEIGISGGGLTSSIISNTSTNSTSNNAASTTILATSSGSSNNGAPIPPSLDSLHQMTKSQTSSEGDRLSERNSDRFLTSPDDWIYPGQFDNMGGHTDHLAGHSDHSEEDGYSTLTRVPVDVANGNRSSGRFSGINGRQAMVTDVESGEVTHAPNYETIKDDNGVLVMSGRIRQESPDSGNDPNYESVDETRAKVALLKARDAEASTNSDRSNSVTPSAPTPHVTVVDVFHKGSHSQREGLSPTVNEDCSQRMRRLNHDYEEVDLSPTSSPPPSQQAILSRSPPTTDVDLLRDRLLDSHTYEELPHATQSRKDLQRKSDGKKKHWSSSEDKKKTKEDKRKSKSEEKKKASATASGGSGEGSAASWDGSKKSDSWETNRTRL